MLPTDDPPESSIGRLDAFSYTPLAKKSIYPILIQNLLLTATAIGTESNRTPVQGKPL